MLRLLGIDLGDKRTGLAVTDTATRLVTPLEPVPGGRREKALFRAIGLAIGEYEPDTLVLGLPLNMDGSEGPRAAQARRLGDRLGAELGARVAYQDERLTTAQADWDLADTGLTHKQKKRRRDSLAAAAILRDYLDREPAPPR